MKFGVVAAVGFSVVGVALGLRLLLLWRRTRKLPELLIGLAFVFEAVISNSLNILEKFHARLGAEWRGPVYSGIVLSSCAAAVCIAIGAWRVFRPRKTWPRVVIAVVVVLLLVYSLDTMTPHNGEYGPRNLAWWWMAILSRAGAHAWMGGEAYSYQARMRRRLRLGLGDPVVANRMWLWACAGAATAMLWLGVGIARTVAGAPGVQHPLTLLHISLMGSVAAVTNWLVFLPPGPYLRWIKRRAARAVAATA
jgi:hypothetical protein